MTDQQHLGHTTRRVPGENGTVTICSCGVVLPTPTPPPSSGLVQRLVSAFTEGYRETVTQTVLVDCGCGRISLPTSAVELSICENHPDRNRYVFYCPCCQVVMAKRAPDAIVRLLTAAGVESVVWRCTAELCEPHYGPPLTADDVLDFLIDLQATPTADVVTLASA